MTPQSFWANVSFGWESTASSWVRMDLPMPSRMAPAMRVLARKMDVEGLFAHAELAGEVVHRQRAEAVGEEAGCGPLQECGCGRPRRQAGIGMEWEEDIGILGNLKRFLSFHASLLFLPPLWPKVPPPAGPARNSPTKRPGVSARPEGNKGKGTAYRRKRRGRRRDGHRDRRHPGGHRRQSRPGAHRPRTGGAGAPPSGAPR